MNDKLSYALPKESKFKIYISALTQLNIDEHNRIPTTDGRLLRRVHKRILSPGEMEQLTLRRADLPRGLKQITIQVEEGAQ